MVEYSTFRVLLDDPAPEPTLGFDVYAQSFAEIIEYSNAQFAIGVFGEWGSGKTTLMRAIEAELAHRTGIVTVWFNAWRYEREPHLIVPLLDTMRQALVDWATQNPIADGGSVALPGGFWSRLKPGRERRLSSGVADPRARNAAGIIGRAAKAFLAGLSLSAGLPGVGLSIDGERILAELQQTAPESADDPQSFYHAGFLALQRAVREFAHDYAGTEETIDRRIVIFVDDLDRCLPSNALQVLESMKVMFDLPGIVFVAGLAQSVIDQAVEVKYREIDHKDEKEVHGPDYIKKLFQVPFALPRIQTDQLPEYFQALIATSDLPDHQVADLMGTVEPHLTYLSGDDSVNPREIKRFINAYTLQVKMLASKLGEGQVHPDVILALQAMNFRSEWRDLYELLAADPAQFREAIQQAMADPDAGGLWVGAEKEPLPVSFLGYMGAEGAALLEVDDLAPYVTSAEFTRSTDPAISEAQAALRILRRFIGTLRDSEGLDSESVSEFNKALEQLASRSILGEGRLVEGLHQRVEDLRRISSQLNPDDWTAQREAWLASTQTPIEEIDQALSELRRRANVAIGS